MRTYYASRPDYRAARIRTAGAWQREHKEAKEVQRARWKARHPAHAEALRQRANAQRRAQHQIASFGFVVDEGAHPMSRDKYQVARALGFRSGLEVAIAAQLDAAGIRYEYESLRIPFSQPQKQRHYAPDYPLPNGIIIESKGRFVTADRQKHLLVKAQHPALDIRFVFSNSRTRISKTSKTTYGAWCEAKGFQYADRRIPDAWLREAPNAASLRAIQTLL